MYNYCTTIRFVTWRVDVTVGRTPGCHGRPLGSGSECSKICALTMRRLPRRSCAGRREAAAAWTKQPNCDDRRRLTDDVAAAADVTGLSVYTTHGLHTKQQKAIDSSKNSYNDSNICNVSPYERFLYNNNADACYPQVKTLWRPLTSLHWQRNSETCFTLFS